MTHTASAAASANGNHNGRHHDDERLLALVDELRAARARQGLKALALAPTLDLYQALMRGEQVPVEQLNADAVARYGVRR